MDDLTPRQRQALDLVTAYLERHGYPPSLRELAALLGVRGTLGVQKHLAALERKGFLQRSGHRSRGLTLNDRPAPALPLPIVGRVAAGGLQPALEEHAGTFPADPRQARPGDFCLRVRGDSMSGAGILDGDLALVRPQATANNGEIVVALVGGEATLKRFFREGKRIRLQPENPALQPIHVTPEDGELRIVGRVTGVWREY